MAKTPKRSKAFAEFNGITEGSILEIGSTTIDTQRQIGRRVVEILAGIDANHVEGQEGGLVKEQVAN